MGKADRSFVNTLTYKCVLLRFGSWSIRCSIWQSHSDVVMSAKQNSRMRTDILLKGSSLHFNTAVVCSSKLYFICCIKVAEDRNVFCGARPLIYKSVCPSEFWYTDVCRDTWSTAAVLSLSTLYQLVFCNHSTVYPSSSLTARHFSPSRNISRLIYLVHLFRARFDCVKCPCSSLGRLRCYNFVKLHYSTLHIVW